MEHVAPESNWLFSFFYKSNTIQFMTSSSATHIELLKCFDEYGNIIEPQTREMVHKKPYSIWHAVTAVWLINDKGEILCTHRSEKNEGNPGKWQTYVGGHVKSHQQEIEAAQSEIAEEIGLSIPFEKLTYIDCIKREDVKHIQYMFALFFNKSINTLKFQDGEITDANWISFEEYKKSKDTTSNLWCNNITKEQYENVIKILAIKIL